MKALALALLLANVLYLAWTQWLGSDDADASSAPPADVPKLVLASEAQGAPKSDAPVARSGKSGSAAADDAPGSNDAPAIASTTPSGSTNPASRHAGSPGGPVELLSGVKRCLSIGPFRELAEASQGSTALRKAGHDPRTRVAQGDVWAGLWVYLEDLPSRNEAQRAVTLLKQRGVQDAYIMPATDRAIDISLGIFSDPVRAQKRAEEVRALGFTPTTADRTRTGTVYWVDVDLKPTDGFIDPAAIPGEQGKITRLQVQACPAEPSRSG